MRSEQKNTIKDSAEFCLLCGKQFANNKEKHINKIRRNKRHQNTTLLFYVQNANYILINQK